MHATKTGGGLGLAQGLILLIPDIDYNEHGIPLSCAGN